jgi:hypothetical protein
MTKIVMAILAAMLTTGCLTGSKLPPVVEVLRPSYLDAVKPIQYLVNEGQALANGCTASSINRREHLWLTAAHCWVEDKTFIADQPAELVEMNKKTDIAIVRVPNYFSGGELTLSTKTPNYLDEIIITGHPFGYDDVFVTRGYVSNPKALLSTDDSIFFLVPGLPSKMQNGFSGYMTFNVAAAPGNSGSPVMTLDGKVLSVLQIGWGRSFSPVSGGALYQDLMWFARYFVVK